jgi:hypothetical protein
VLSFVSGRPFDRRYDPSLEAGRDSVLSVFARTER